MLLAIGTSADHLDSEWDSFANDIRSGRKRKGKIFTYIEGVPIAALPRGLRQTQTFIHGKGSLERLYNFINKALSPSTEQPERQSSIERATKEQSSDIIG